MLLGVRNGRANIRPASKTCKSEREHRCKAVPIVKCQAGELYGVTEAYKLRMYMSLSFYMGRKELLRYILIKVISSKDLKGWNSARKGKQRRERDV